MSSYLNQFFGSIICPCGERNATKMIEVRTLSKFNAVSYLCRICAAEMVLAFDMDMDKFISMRPIFIILQNQNGGFLIFNNARNLIEVLGGRTYCEEVLRGLGEETELGQCFASYPNHIKFIMSDMAEIT